MAWRSPTLRVPTQRGQRPSHHPQADEAKAGVCARISRPLPATTHATTTRRNPHHRRGRHSRASRAPTHNPASAETRRHAQSPHNTRGAARDAAASEAGADHSQWPATSAAAAQGDHRAAGAFANEAAADCCRAVAALSAAEAARHCGQRCVIAAFFFHMNYGILFFRSDSRVRFKLMHNL